MSNQIPASLDRQRIEAAFRGLCGAVLLSGLVGCASQTAMQSPEPPQRLAKTAADAVAQQNNTPAVDASEPEGSAATVFLGTDQTVKPLPKRPPIRLDGDAVMLNFEQAPLAEVVHSIMGDTLGLDYVVDHPVNGEITIRTRSPVPRDQLLPILEALLRNNGVVMVRGPEDRFYVSGSPDARLTMPSLTNAGGDLMGFNHVVVPLQYIGAPEMADILKPVAPADAFVRIDANRNLLILAGTQLQLQGWLDIVSSFDVDQLEGMSVGIFPLKNSAVDDIFQELNHIVSGPEGEGLGSGFSSLVRLMPVERLNSILAVSPRAHYIDRIRGLVERLDEVEDPVSEPTLNVYPVKNGNAAQLASLLSQIYGGGTGGGRAAKANQRSVAPGMEQQGNARANPQGGGAGAAGGANFTIGENIRVVSDDYNNALLVYAAPYEYNKIKRTLEQLDVIATQVLIEASIVEVTLTDDLKYGLEWTFDQNLGGGDVGTGLLDLGGNLGAAVPGFSYTITDSASSVKAVINTLAQKSLVNVLSTPSVMVLDNNTATIQVGDQQPVQSQQTITNGGNVQASITYIDTGVKLEVTPSVNDGGLVTMQIAQEVKDVGPVDVATGQRSFNNRNVNSKVAVRNGESIVLGGLIRDNASQGRSGIPLLMDIPVLGSLFSTTTDNETRTELLVFITPRVIESDDDLRAVSNEMKARMRGITDFSDLPAAGESTP